MNDPEVLELYTKLVLFKNDSCDTVQLSLTLSAQKWRIVCMLADRLDLAHISKSSGEQRVVEIIRKRTLTQEQHDILERHFQQEPKPSTHTKRGFSDMLNVPIDKISVRSSQSTSSVMKFC